VTIRGAQLHALARPVRRSVRWQPVVTSGVLVALLLWWRHGTQPGGPGVELVRACGLVLGVGTAFLLDDPAAPTTAAVPLPLSWRSAYRVVFGVVLVAVLWGGVLTWAVRTSAYHLPWGGLTLQAAAWTLLVLAVAATARRLGDLDEPGAATAAGMTVLALLIHLLPAWLLLTGDPATSASLTRWGAVLLVAVLALWLAVRDPAAPRVVPRVRG
jgi:hypothetical protein